MANAPEQRVIYTESARSSVTNIGPYLTPDESNTIVLAQRGAPDGLPEMLRGSQPTDGGHLLLTPSERNRLLAESQTADQFIRRYVGAAEHMNGHERYCIWVRDGEAGEASAIPQLRRRFDAVRAFRLRSSTTAQSMADRPYRFMQRPHKDTTSIIVPRVSSERREYIPMGFVGQDTVISDSANAIYDAEPWVFGLIQSRMHMVWVHTVAGRLETRLRYSAVLCYNTFPVPPLSSKDKQRLTEGAVGILRAREMYSDKTLAELYDPDKMPAPLRDAHRTLDDIVDSLYQQGERKFESDDARLERLFNMYAEATKADGSISAAGPEADAQPDLAEGDPDQPELISSAD